MKLQMKQASVIDSEKSGRIAHKERRDAGLTLAQVAERMQISESYLSYLERGEKNWTQDLAESFNKALKG